jgi:phosphoglycolate phosphatase-like HAD superfamily hydrolase
VNLLLFDIDGTLTDTNRHDDRLFRAAVAEVVGREVEIPSWDVFPEVTCTAVARALLTREFGRPAVDREIMAVRDAFTRLWFDAVRDGSATAAALAGANELLRDIRARKDCVVAIVTGGWGPTALLKLQTSALDVGGLVIVTSDDEETRRGILGTAAIFAAAERGTPGFSAVVLIGDGTWDAEAARAYGAGFVGIAADEGRAERLRAAGAAAVLPHYADRAAFWRGVDSAIAARRR